MLTDIELQFYYFGFYRVLKRYRFTSVLGWCVVLAAVLSIPFGWNLGRKVGFIEVVLTGLTVLAGLTVVWQNISALEEYVRMKNVLMKSIDRAVSPEPIDDPNPQPAVLEELRELMKDVHEGGWQEAHQAIGTLKQMQARSSLPKLE